MNRHLRLSGLMIMGLAFLVLAAAPPVKPVTVKGSGLSPRTPG